jgi:hypothetical protein
MDFIERLLGISPDSGSGALELSIILAVIASIAAIVCMRRVNHALTRSANENQSRNHGRAPGRN